jgi:lambda family phage tail tape measure protein
MAMNMDAMLRIKADVQGENNIRRLGNSMQGLQGQVKNAALGFSNLRGAVAGFGAAIAGSAVVGGLTAIVKQAIDAGDELFNLQAKTGVAASALIGIGNAAKLADVDMATLGKGLTRLNVNLVKAAEGNEELGRKFQALGVSVKTADGQVVPAEKALKQIADRFADMPDGAQKAAAAVAIFGKSGADLIPLLNEGAASMEKFTYKVGEDFAARSDLFNDTITELGIKTQGFGVELTDALLPSLQSILEVFSDLFDTKNDWDALFAVIKVGIQSVATFLFATIKLFDVFIKNSIAAFQVIARALKGDFQGAVDLYRDRVAGTIEQARQDFAQIKKIFSEAPSPGTGRRQGGRAMGLDTTDENRRAETASKSAAAAAKRAATEQQRIEERRQNLTKKSNDLLKQYRESIEDLDNQIAGVGADPLQQLMLKREQATMEAKRSANEMTLAVVELRREIESAGFELRPQDWKAYGDAISAITERQNALAEREYSEGLAKIGEDASAAAIDLLEFNDAASSQKDALSGARSAIDDYLQSVGTLSENISNVTTNAFSGLEDAIVSLTTTGTFSFRQFALAIVEDLTRMVTRMLIIAPLLQFIQSLIPGGPFASANAGLSGIGALKSFLPGFALNAAGNVYGANGVVPFARGGIVNGPTMFPFAKGIGLMGEAGPEAIMPLRRGADGRLGVAASGGAGVNVTVNVDAGNSQVQGDGPNANQLGRVIGAAVQAEIVKQQRPGGLLATTR